MAFHLVITNLFIRVLPRLHKVKVNIKSAHYLLIQLNESCKGAFCNHINRFDIILTTIVFQLKNNAILSKMLSSKIAGLKTTKELFTG